MGERKEATVPTAIYPGTFDPVTRGHVDIALRAAKLFDHVVIAVYDAPPKRLLFTTEERVTLWQQALPEGCRNITVEKYAGLTVDFARYRGAQVIVRGLRAATDFMYEFDMALMNKKMAPEVEEIYLVTDLAFLFVSSSRIKEVWELGRQVEDLVPPNVAAALRGKFIRD
ncbi:MAG: pantetheine-phosphate adenylyltransferase [Chloroflexi bacterium]|nr:pantetheine-phosphate adenylyltransferase [Chloroflexota bacterium]